jgi:non-ribosomal peptide synthetase component F
LGYADNHSREALGGSPAASSPIETAGLRAHETQEADLLPRLDAAERHRVLVERSIDLGVAQLAILKCGAAYVPLDRSAPLQRQAFMIADCEARLVLTAVGSTAPEMAGVTRVDIDHETLTGPDTREWDRSANGEAIAYVMYTSGSTGQPKGVMVPHRAIGGWRSTTATPISGRPTGSPSLPTRPSTPAQWKCGRRSSTAGVRGPRCTESPRRAHGNRQGPGRSLDRESNRERP